MWLNAGALSTSGNAYMLTKSAQASQVSAGASVDPQLGTSMFQQGLLALQGATDSLGNPASNILVRAGATVSFYDTSTQWDKNSCSSQRRKCEPLQYNGNSTPSSARSLSMVIA